MIFLFAFSISAAAITFMLFYTWCVQLPANYLTRFFGGASANVEDETMDESLPPHIKPFIWFPLKGVLFLGETYIQAGWGAYCVLRSYEAITKAGVRPGWGYHFVAFVSCLAALGYIARKEKRKDILSIIQSCIGMGSYIVFCLSPGALSDYYPWLVAFFR